MEQSGVTELAHESALG